MEFGLTASSGPCLIYEPTSGKIKIFNPGIVKLSNKLNDAEQFPSVRNALKIFKGLNEKDLEGVTLYHKQKGVLGRIKNLTALIDLADQALTLGANQFTPKTLDAIDAILKAKKTHEELKKTIKAQQTLATKPGFSQSDLSQAFAIGSQFLTAISDHRDLKNEETVDIGGASSSSDDDDDDDEGPRSLSNPFSVKPKLRKALTSVSKDLPSGLS